MTTDTPTPAKLVRIDVTELATRYGRRSDEPDGPPHFSFSFNEIMEFAEALLHAKPAATPDGLPFGIIDPDYARIYTKARILAWQYGYACVMHGSFTRDLDLLLVPWEGRASTAVVEPIIKMLAESCNLTIRADDPFAKPHGRKCWSLHLPGFGEPRWVDISVMPTLAITAAQGNEEART